MESKIVLIRHGLTEGNLKKWYYGHADLPLSEEGIEQITGLTAEGLYPEAPEWSQLFTTGLTRTEQTFELIYGQREHGTIEKLREMNFGIYECNSFEDLKDDPVFLEWGYDTEGDVVLPEGESRNQFFARIGDGLQELLGLHHQGELKLRHKGKDAVTIMICHGGVITTMMAKLFPDQYENPWDWMPKPGYGYIVNFKDGSPVSWEKIGEAKDAEDK